MHMKLTLFLEHPEMDVGCRSSTLPNFAMSLVTTLFNSKARLLVVYSAKVGLTPLNVFKCRSNHRTLKLRISTLVNVEG